MLIAIPDVLDRAEVASMRQALLAADWTDGNVTSGPQAALAKRNRQLPENAPVATEIGGRILDALGRTPLFVAAALPLKVYPPLFNRYAESEGFGIHIDNAIRIKPGTDFRIRSDLSVTLFLSDPEEYDGGELRIKGNSGAHSVKLPAGHLALYPASSLHHVTTVTRGERLASFFWVQSMVRDDTARRLLLELDQTIQSLAAERGQGDGEIIKLTGIYHNLLRMWADA